METEKYTQLQMIALALLRVVVGWHFLYEGIAKLMKPNWTAASFLLQARGPLANFFHWMANSPEALRYVNLMNIWGLILIGLGLIVGCLTRTASGAGILLILLYYFCNPPFVGYFYSIPAEGSYLIINKNLVEAAALLVTLALASGQFYGIDRIFHRFRAARRAALDLRNAYPAEPRPSGSGPQ